MTELSRFEFVLLFVTAFAAIMSLVKLMRARRDWLVAHVQKQVDAERVRRKREAKKEQEQQRRAA